MDLIVRNAKLRYKEGLIDIGINDDRIVELAAKSKSIGRNEIDAEGHLVTPPFVNIHLHLDKCLTGDWIRTASQTEMGTFGIAPIAAKMKHARTQNEIKDKALTAVRSCILNGNTAIRAFADVGTAGGLTGIRSLLEIKRALSDKVDLQVVAFPQEGIIRDPGAEELLRKALDIGSDVVGGMPWFEFTQEDARKHIDLVFEMAKNYDKDIHMLVDDTDDPDSKNLLYLSYKAVTEKWIGRVAASHCRGALESPNDAYAKKVVELVTLGRMTIVDNPHICLFLYGRRDKYPIRRSITRIKDFLNAGVNVAIGQDDIDDPYYPFGRGDQLENAFFMIHAGQLSHPDQIGAALDMVTVNGANGMRLQGYGIDIGKKADLVILNAKGVHEAFRMHSNKTHVVKNGKLIAESKFEEKVHLNLRY